MPKPSIVSLPNLLTYGRLVAVPLFVAALMLVEGIPGRWLALGIFIAAAVTDWLDGYLARLWSQQSALGRMLDPIADKLLVGTALLMLVHDRTISGITLVAAIIVLCREILVSGLREYLAELDVKVHVTHLAKWKTAAQLAALAVLLLAPAVQDTFPAMALFGVLLLWLAAVLTLITGYDYLRAGIRHATRPHNQSDL